MTAELDLLGQELERWAAMEAAREDSAAATAAAAAARGAESSGTKREPAPSSPPKPKKKRVRRQREELLYLRKKAKQLEDELARLAQREAGADSQPSPAADGTTAALWEGIASRQLAVRREAEGENERLKRTLENQIALARRFERFLQGSGGSTGVAPAQTPRADAQTASGGAFCFKDMLSELRALYETVDQILPLVGPRTTTPTVHNAQVAAHPSATGVTIQWPTNVVVPFEWRVAARGVWRSISNKCLAGHIDSVENHVVSDHVVVRSIVFTLEEGREAQWHARQVVQRFVEAERTVIVAHSVWASPDAPGSRFHGARLVESLRLVVCRAADSHGGSACVQGLAEMLSDCSHQSDAGELTELVLRSVERSMRTMWPVVQSALIEEDLIQEAWDADAPSDQAPTLGHGADEAC